MVDAFIQSSEYIVCVQVEDELASVGENMKQLEKSAEEAVEREEKLKDRILQLQQKYKAAEARFEYGEMKITKLNHKVLSLVQPCSQGLGQSKVVH